MGLEEEKVGNHVHKQQLPNKHRMMFGVPVIIEENSSSNQMDKSAAEKPKESSKEQEI